MSCGVATLGRVKRLGVALVTCLALLVGGSAFADPVPPTPPADLHVCTRPGKAPYWFDYADGAVPFWRLFAQPGAIAAVPNLQLPAQIRARGGLTVYFDPHLKERVGLPNVPVDPSLLPSRVDRFFLYVENSTVCSNPIIAENELYGAGLPTPWTPTVAQYRANVLRFLTLLHDKGAQPWLLVNSQPATDGDAGDWWRAVAQVAGIVREIYFPAPLLYKQGPVLASRTLRTAFRRGILDFTKLGIPTSKLGIFLGFQTTKGTGGREGLKPASAWFEVVKLQALAAKQVAKEMKFHGIWSWGWAQYATTKGEIDPDKQRAACVYLWTRNPKLCNGPALAGKGFNRSRIEGQLSLPNAIRCQIEKVGNVTWNAIRPLQTLTGDGELSFADAYARVLESRYAKVTSKEILAAERTIVSARFNGSNAAYRAALANAHATLAIARGVIGDELRRTRIQSRFKVAAPTGDAVAEYQSTYGDLQVRRVQASARAQWLGGKKIGYALESNSPAPVMRLPSGRWSTVFSALGAIKIRPLGPPLPLSSVSLSQVRPSVRAALVAQLRDARYPTWIAAQQKRSFSNAVCWRDQLPETGIVDLTEYLPFLALA